jgi:hypothetical protein
MNELTISKILTEDVAQRMRENKTNPNFKQFQPKIMIESFTLSNGS